MQLVELREGLTEYYRQEYPDYSDISITEITRMTENWETIVYTYKLGYQRADTVFSKALIIRLYPGQDGEEKAKKEFNLMASLMMTTIQVPDPFRLEVRNNLQLPFVIMEYIKGQLLSIRLRDDTERQNFYLNHFARILAEIHTVDYETMISQSTMYQVADDPYHYLARLLTSFKDLIEIHNKKEFIPVLRWLVERMDTVPHDKLSLLHGDYHLANVMVDDQDEMYVIDWIDGSIGDYRVDLAWTLIIHETNISKEVRDIILNYYRAHSPFAVEGIKYFEVLAILRQLLDISINFTFDNEIARLNPSKVNQIRDNLEPIKRSLGILYGHTKIRLDQFKKML